MKYTKEQLVEVSKVYFDNEETNLLYATSDGQFFFERDLNHAKNYVFTNKSVEIIPITRLDVFPVEVCEFDGMDKDDLIKYAAGLEPVLKLTKNMSIDTMINKIKNR